MKEDEGCQEMTARGSSRHGSPWNKWELGWSQADISRMSPSWLRVVAQQSRRDKGPEADVQSNAGIQRSPLDVVDSVRSTKREWWTRARAFRALKATLRNWSVSQKQWGTEGLLCVVWKQLWRWSDEHSEKRTLVRVKVDQTEASRSC